MKKLNPSQVAVISASISAVATVLVAFIGIVPHLREGDAKKVEDLRAEVAKLTQTVGGLTISAQQGRTGTPANQGEEMQAPHIQLRWAAADASAQDQYVAKAKEALKRSGFTGIGINSEVVFGFDREYTGLVWRISPDTAVFVAAGPDWQVADKDAENLKRGF